MKRIILSLLLAPLLAYAGDWDIASAPYLRTCGANIHVWWYERDAYSTYRWPGVSCTGTDCLPSTAYVSTVLPILSAANPASAAASAIDAAVSFRCDGAVMTEQTPRGALCRERSQFARAHLKDIGFRSWTWAKVADDGGAFTLASTNTVRYGAGDSGWRQANFPAGTYACHKESFTWDDPAPGAPKTCEAVTYLDPQEPTCTAPPTHRVKPNPGQTTRPVYAVVNGVRSTTATANVRATVGAACDAKVQFPSGTDAYMAFAPDFAADKVTLCKQ